MISIRFVYLVSVVTSTMLSGPVVRTLWTEDGIILGELEKRGANYVVYKIDQDTRLKYMINCEPDGYGGIVLMNPHPLLVEQDTIRLMKDLVIPQDFPVSEPVDVVTIDLLNRTTSDFSMPKDDLRICIENGAQLRYAHILVSKGTVPLASVTSDTAKRLIDLVENLHQRGYAHGSIGRLEDFASNTSTGTVYFAALSHAIHSSNSKFDSVRVSDKGALMELLNMERRSGTPHEDAAASHELVSSTFSYLPAPDLSNDMGDGGYVLGQRRGRGSGNVLIYDVESNPEILIEYRYGRSSRDRAEIAELNNRAYNAGISLSHMSVSELTPFPQTLNFDSKKFGFRISEVLYNKMRSRGYGVYYTVYDTRDPSALRRSRVSKVIIPTRATDQLKQARYICTRVAHMVDELNSMGIVHGDITPETVWFVKRRDGRQQDFKLVRFDNSRLHAKDDESPNNMDWISVLKLFEWFISKNESLKDFWVDRITQAIEQIEQSSDTSPLDIIHTLLNENIGGVFDDDTPLGDSGSAGISETVAIEATTTLPPSADGRPTTQPRR